MLLLDRCIIDGSLAAWLMSTQGLWRYIDGDFLPSRGFVEGVFWGLLQRLMIALIH